MGTPRPEDLLEEQKAYYRARAPEYGFPWRGSAGVASAPCTELDPCSGLLRLAASQPGTRQLASDPANASRIRSRLRLNPSGPERAGTAAEPTAEQHGGVASSVHRVPATRAELGPGERPEPRPARPSARRLGAGRPGLAPDGRVFLVDSARSELNRGLAEDATDRRTLDDGRQFTVVKRYFRPEELQAELLGLGWDLDVRATGESFVHASGGRAAPQ